MKMGFIKKSLSIKKYINKFVQLAVNAISPIIYLWEKGKIKKYASSPLRHEPIFIIGSPRTGSTILYQSLSNEADVLYVDNLSCLFNRNFFFGCWLSNKLFKQKAHNCFKSNHGDTSKCGWHAPSECGQFWYRWLPKDRHFIDFDELSDQEMQKIKREVTAVSNYFKKPVLFKNLNAGQRLRLLSTIFPGARLIFVRRDPFFTAQSILRAKRKIGISDNDFWSIMPPNATELKVLSWPEQIVKQIFYLEKQISKDLQLFSRKNVFEVDYLNLDQKLVEELCGRLRLNTKTSYKSSQINLNEKILLTDEEVLAIRVEINKLDWTEKNVK